jgi:hypothetical protein
MKKIFGGEAKQNPDITKERKDTRTMCVRGIDIVSVYDYSILISEHPGI